MAAELLKPVLPTAGDAISLTGRAHLVMGSAPTSDVHLEGDGIAARHAVLENVQGRWLVADAAATLRVNGMPIQSATRLFDRDIIELSAQHRWEFVSGEARTRELPLQLAVPAPARRRRNVEFEKPERPFPWKALFMFVFACVLFGAAYAVIRFGPRTADSALAVLSDQQAARFDSLLIVAYDHLERANSLLELGIQDEAAQEFARGINTLALSPLRNHPQVKPRIAALENSVAAIYRSRRLAVPDAYANARIGMSADQMRAASLTREQFAYTFDLVAAAFRLRYHTNIIVVGRDHPEHLALYGPGGALDLRSKIMTNEQVAFVVIQCHSYGIRVKDFSQDSILQRQVRAAINAGLSDRAGTGLHLHIDRFADRRDRWTVSALPLGDYTNKNFSRAIPATESSSPSSIKYGSPRSTMSSLRYVPLSDESIR